LPGAEKERQMSPNMFKWRFFAAVIVLLIVLGSAGCKSSLPVKKEEPAPMVRVEVHFTSDSEPLVGFMRSLEMDKEGMIMQGGSSFYKLYDEQGNVLAIFNYSRVEYIKVLY